MFQISADSLISPPISPLINTNEAIPESELSGSRGLLHDVESELRTIGTEIMRTQEYILSPQERQAAYVEDMKKLPFAMAPLPTEIAEKVIKRGIHDYHNRSLARSPGCSGISVQDGGR